MMTKARKDTYLQVGPKDHRRPEGGGGVGGEEGAQSPTPSLTSKIFDTMK